MQFTHTILAFWLRNNRILREPIKCFFFWRKHLCLLLSKAAKWPTQKDFWQLTKAQLSHLKTRKKRKHEKKYRGLVKGMEQVVFGEKHPVCHRKLRAARPQQVAREFLRWSKKLWNCYEICSCISLIWNQTTFLVQFGINMHSWVYSKLNSKSYDFLY